MTGKGCILTGILCLLSGTARADSLGLKEIERLNLLCRPTQIVFAGDTDAIAASGNGRIFYRRNGGHWETSPVETKGGRALVRLPDGRWLICDTENRRLLLVSDLSGKEAATPVSALGGITLERPLDILMEPGTPFIWLLDSGHRVFRFTSVDSPATVLQFHHPQEIGDPRGLSFFDGRLHIIDSSRGEVMRIDDFWDRRYTVFRAPRPPGTPRDVPAGSMSTTGPVLNDVQKIGEWYYGSDFFSPTYAKGGDITPGRLLRWRNWKDFQSGKWEDVTPLLPGGDVRVTPFFLTAHNDSLYIPYFDGESPCSGGGVLFMAGAGE
ncbi:hypothetical protein LOC54_03820 [Acetobacter sp. AN02]|uniref:hypothetical protein n=1 Tax=Acetobacter sp. AN02 TaxID=2894186 RepID=UPI002434127D|nr:hypothetical protein [Acetobacter sp. AN02]MDG6094247.1 hypothetical protein [Acetobacter sp. AN02]